MQQTWRMPYGPPPTPRGSGSARESRGKQARAKPVRITVDLTPADYQVLNRWLAGASVELDEPASRMTVARGIRAMIQAAAADRVVSDAVLGIMREDQR